MFKKVKTGQALVETIVVLGLYFFIIGFTISGFQVMYNKMVFSVAAYEACRETIAYESSKKFATEGNSGTGLYDRNAYSSAVGKRAGAVVLLNNILAPKMFVDSSGNSIKPEVEAWEDYIIVNGISASDFSSSNTSSRNATEEFNPTKHMYCVSFVEARMNYLFPIISPNLEGLIDEQITVSSSFVLAKERIWNS